MLIIVMGLPGSGKTYFAKRLADTLSCEYINSDDVRMNAGYRARYQAKDKFEVYHIMLNMVTNILERGETAIVDATFYRRPLRALFINLAYSLGVTVRCILITADEEVVKKRLSRPRLNSEADFEVFKLLRAEFQSVDDPHLSLRSTDNNISHMIDAAISYLYPIRHVFR